MNTTIPNSAKCCSCTRLTPRNLLTLAPEAKGGSLLHLFCPDHKNHRHCSHVGKCQEHVASATERHCTFCKVKIEACMGFVVAGDLLKSTTEALSPLAVREVCGKMRSKGDF